jgi:hypothetical protein
MSCLVNNEELKRQILSLITILKLRISHDNHWELIHKAEQDILSFDSKPVSTVTHQWFAEITNEEADRLQKLSDDFMRFASGLNNITLHL